MSVSRADPGSPEALPAGVAQLRLPDCDAEDLGALIDELVDNAVAPPPAAPRVAPSSADEELLAAKRGSDFSFEGMGFLAKIVDLYDGDTVRIAFRFDGRIVQWRARMAGYDSPEMKPPKNSPTREAEKAAALAAREALAAKVGEGLVVAECGAFDKYGRILLTIFLDSGENVNKWMVAQGHGVPYDGGTKKIFAA